MTPFLSRSLPLEYKDRKHYDKKRTETEKKKGEETG